MKTTLIPFPKARLAALAALIAGLAVAIPAATAGTDAKSCDPDTTACCGKCCKSATTKTAKKAKAPKQKAVKKGVTGSNLKQRVAVERFPETTSPVEVMDREVIDRSGAATLSGFLARQSTFR